MLVGLVAGTIAGAVAVREENGYTVELPSSAVVVSDWDSLKAETARYPETALVYKYGGWVVEVDDVIVLAVDESMIQDITDADADEECDEAEEEDGQLVKRCSHRGCFNHAICVTYTGCWICRINNYTTGRGVCI